MFKSRTVFVVGAGASNEIGLPIGGQLTKRIAELMAFDDDGFDRGRGGDRLFEDALQTLYQRSEWSNSDLYNSARHLAEGMELASSIDTYLETHSRNREFVMLGKLGIVRAIAMAERASRITGPDQDGKGFRIGGISDSWYVSLARQLFSGIPAETPERAFENIAFISFNYDRCIEVFLARAVEVYFRLDRGHAESLVQRVPIIHPYGALGSPFRGAPDFVAYGSDQLDLVAAAERIRTFSESLESEKLKLAIRNQIDEAETIVFLGFGFHHQNMDLIDSGISLVEERRIIPRIFATTLGLSDDDQDIVTGQLETMFDLKSGDFLVPGEQVSTFQGECFGLFSAYWRSLTAAPDPEYGKVNR